MSLPSEVQSLSANQILLTYLNWRLRYPTSVFEIQTSAILEFYFRFRSRPVRRNLHVILYQATDFCPNRSTHCGNMMSYPFLNMAATTDIINHRYLISYWLTRNRLLPIVRHCAEAIEKVDWPIYDAFINRSKYRVPHLPICKHQQWVIVELKCIYRSVSAFVETVYCK